MFGPSLWDTFVYLDTGADKDEALEQYRGTDCYWIEDKPENADLGIELGLDSILMGHDFNANYSGSAKRVTTWKEIYEIITGN